MLLLALLVVMSGFLWTRVFETAENIDTATTCNPPDPVSAHKPGQPQTQPAALGKMLPRSALDQTSPVPPQGIPVRVLNGNGESRQATLISDELASLGFAKGGPADNDPVYTNYELHCHGQIRFGPAGDGAARTLSLIAPCAQLVRDERQDAGVDFALGSEFDDIKTTSEAKKVLQELKNWVPQQGQSGDAQQAVKPPPINNDLLTEARDVHC